MVRYARLIVGCFVIVIHRAKPAMDGNDKNIEIKAERSKPQRRRKPNQSRLAQKT